MIEVDIGVPIPTILGRTGSPPKYPFKKMNIGDSFRADIPTKSMSNAASAYSRRHGAKFTVRKEGNGSRVWRIE